MINYWWVTRPKRKLNAIPSVLALFSEQALNQVWDGQRNAHLSFEDALEESGLKRKGVRRDHTGGGARTYRSWLMSLGLLFTQSDTKQLQLTLAGEAIMNGASPVKILTNQILKYQFPSSYSIGRNVDVNIRFKIHPFWFLLKLLMDSRIMYLTQEEIGKIIITEAENESDKCYEYIIQRIIQFRNVGDKCLSPDFIQLYKTSKRIKNDDPYAHLMDVANTIINWLEYTQYIYRENTRISVLEDMRDIVRQITNTPLPFISRPQDHEFFQRKYGLDPAHHKDTRNLSGSQTVTPFMIAEHIIKQEFVSLALQQPIGGITKDIIDKLVEKTGINYQIVSEVLQKNYPHGAIGSFMTSYFELAFSGKEKKYRDFEIATAEIFKNVFGMKAKHIAGGAREVPDILLVSEEGGYQAIVDTKAYSKYQLGSTQRDRMIYHYLPHISSYSDSSLPLGFFSYIAGGFSKNIKTSLNIIVQNTGINGSAVPVSCFIRLIELHDKKAFSPKELLRIFSSNKCVELGDLFHDIDHLHYGNIADDGKKYNKK